MVRLMQHLRGWRNRRYSPGIDVRNVWAAVVCVAVVVVFIPDSAFAGSKHSYKYGGKKSYYGYKGGYRYGYGPKRYYGYKRNYYKPYYKPYYYRPYYGRYYGYGPYWRYSYFPRFRYYSNWYYVGYPRPPVYVVPAPRYVAPPVRYAQPSVPPPQAQTAARPGECLMIREYQTKVTVGGKSVEAYGDACLQPDGSWRRGPPKLVPNF